MLNFENKLNPITLAYTAQLSLKMQKTNIGAQKIDKFLLKTYEKIITAFKVLDKLSCSWFFQKTFLLTDISIKVVLGMVFLIVSNADIQLAEKELTWKIYIPKKALPITCRVQFLRQKKFAKTVVDENIEVFVVHISSWDQR